MAELVHVAASSVNRPNCVIQALTRSSMERKVLETCSREFVLFPDYSRVGPENQIGGRVGN
jgi:hypothetical protein